MRLYYLSVVAVGICFLTLGFLITALIAAGLAGACLAVQRRRQLKGLYSSMKQSLTARQWPGWSRPWTWFGGRPAAPRRSDAPDAQSGAIPFSNFQDRDPGIADIRRAGFDTFSDLLVMLHELIPFHSAVLFEYDNDSRMAFPRVFSTKSADAFKHDCALMVSDGIVGYCLSTGKPVHYPDFPGNSRQLGYYRSDVPVASVMALPLTVYNHRVGALVIDHPEKAAFEGKMEGAERIARLAADLMLRAEREEALCVRLGEHRMLKEMTERMSKAGVRLADVAGVICSLARDSFPAERATFVALDDKTGPFSAENLADAPGVVPFRSLKWLNHQTELVARTRKTVRVDDLRDTGMFVGPGGKILLSTRSVLAAPFVFEDNVVGVVLLESDRRKAFSAFHESALIDLVTHAAAAVARAIDYGTMEKKVSSCGTVPEAAKIIFEAETVEPLAQLVASRFAAQVRLFEIAWTNGGAQPHAWGESSKTETLPAGWKPEQESKQVNLLRHDGGYESHFHLGNDAAKPDGSICLRTPAPLADVAAGILEQVAQLLSIRLVLEKRERHFSFLKRRDPLTGILNTASLEKHLESLIAAGEPFEFMLVQPRQIAALHRTWGYQQTLRQYAALAAELQKAAGPESVTGRVGICDFGIIMTGQVDTVPIRRQIQHIVQQAGSAGLGAAFASVRHPHDVTTLSEVYEHANAKLTESFDVPVPS